MKKLSKKRDMFVREYLKDMNATRAAIAAEWEFATIPQVGWYVYFLIDPRDDQIFYVGKGKGKRIHTHTSSNSVDRNITKRFRIREICARGDKVREVVFEVFAQEDDAYVIEGQLIRELQHAGLTNKAQGAADPRTDALAMLAALKPFDRWVSTTDRYTLDVTQRVFGDLRKFYDYFVETLIGIAERPINDGASPQNS